MNIVLLIIQILLALFFIALGFMHVSKPLVEIREMGDGRMHWVEDVGEHNFKMIGTMEILGGIGLILPQLTGIMPWLTPVAALGLFLLMVAAAIFHLRRGDGMESRMINNVPGGLGRCVAVGRFALLPA
jgi:uncharacterized membrane protein YphA (DoxX/SURF4 family)